MQTEFQYNPNMQIDCLSKAIYTLLNENDINVQKLLNYKLKVLQELMIILKNIYAKIEVKIFGSFYTGFSLFDSDIDLVLEKDEIQTK